MKRPSRLAESSLNLTLKPCNYTREDQAYKVIRYKAIGYKMNISGCTKTEPK